MRALATFWYCRKGSTVIGGVGGGPAGNEAGVPNATRSMKSLMSLRKKLSLPRKLSPAVHKSFFRKLNPISLFLPTSGRRFGLGWKQKVESAPGPGVPDGQRK